MANLAALRAAVFFAICEKPEGGGMDNRPPAVRRLRSIYPNLTFLTNQSNLTTPPDE